MENAKLEARVWSRIMGVNVTETAEKCEITELLEQEHQDLMHYRFLIKKLPQFACLTSTLVMLAEENIKILKTMFFVKYGRCFIAEKCEKEEVSCVCGFLRKQYFRVQKELETVQKGANNMEKGRHNTSKMERNKRRQAKILLCLLQGLL